MVTQPQPTSREGLECYRVKKKKLRDNCVNCKQQRTVISLWFAHMS